MTTAQQAQGSGYQGNMSGNGGGGLNANSLGGTTGGGGSMNFNPGSIPASGGGTPAIEGAGDIVSGGEMLFG
jgi:hypothetical protein